MAVIVDGWCLAFALTLFLALDFLSSKWVTLELSVVLRWWQGPLSVVHICFALIIDWSSSQVLGNVVLVAVWVLSWSCLRSVCAISDSLGNEWVEDPFNCSDILSQLSLWLWLQWSTPLRSRSVSHCRATRKLNWWWCRAIPLRWEGVEVTARESRRTRRRRRGNGVQSNSGSNGNRTTKTTRGDDRVTWCNTVGSYYKLVKSRRKQQEKRE